VPGKFHSAYCRDFAPCGDSDFASIHMLYMPVSLAALVLSAMVPPPSQMPEKTKIL
jgi:hypothetical protein